MSHRVNLPHLTIMVVGDVSVGKTTLINSLIDLPTENYPSFSPTITADFYSKGLTIGDTNFDVHIWDTAGHDRDGNLSKKIVTDSNIILYLWDVSEVDKFRSLSSVMEWNYAIDNILASVEGNNKVKVMKAMIGTKLDRNNALEIKRNQEYFISLPLLKDPSSILNRPMEELTNGVIYPTGATKEKGIQQRVQLIEYLNKISKIVLTSDDYHKCFLTTSLQPQYGIQEAFSQIIKHYITKYPNSLSKQTESPINDRIIIRHDDYRSNKSKEFSIGNTCC